VNSIYYGAELDAGYEGAQAHVSLDNPWATGNQRVIFDTSLRARLGYTLGWGASSSLLAGFPTLVYATLGVSGADIKRAAFVNNAVTGVVAQNATEAFYPGLKVGAGVEAAATTNVTVRAEYMFGEYFGPKVQTHQIRLGGAYHF
jgi:opacity protein-like surface antigen